MLNLLFKTPLASTRAPSLPLLPGRTVYAVGDIHGCFDLLDSMLDAIESDILTTAPDNPVVVFLGDYVDRGPESAETVRRLAELWRNPPLEMHFLKGNHEAAMLDFMDHPDEQSARWLTFGGLQTLLSYGVVGVSPVMRDEALDQAAAQLRERAQAEDDFLRLGLTTSVQFGNVFLCHAAVNPSLPLDMQPERTLMWGHPDFLRRGGGDQGWVVHGHTIVPEPEVGPNRICVDTGAYYSGQLSAARLSDGERRFLTVTQHRRACM